MSEFPEFNGLSATQLSAIAEEVWNEKNRLEDELKVVADKYRHLMEFRIPSALEAEGLRNLKLLSGRGVTTTEETFVNVKAEDRDFLHQWLKDHGHGDIVKETVHPGTLKSFVKEAAKNAEPLPVHLLSIHTARKAKWF